MLENGSSMRTNLPRNNSRTSFPSALPSANDIEIVGSDHRIVCQHIIQAVQADDRQIENGACRGTASIPRLLRLPIRVFKRKPGPRMWLAVAPRQMMGSSRRRSRRSAFQDVTPCWSSLHTNGGFDHLGAAYRRIRLAHQVTHHAVLADFGTPKLPAGLRRALAIAARVETVQQKRRNKKAFDLPSASSCDFFSWRMEPKQRLALSHIETGADLFFARKAFRAKRACNC